MNALAPTNARPLVAVSVDEAREPLVTLCSAYDPPFGEKSQALMAARVRAYMLGLGKLPGWAISEAVMAFIEGRVERPSRRIGILPTVEELATETRKIVEREGSRQQSAAQFARRPIERIPFLEKLERKRAEYADRQVLFTNVDLDKARMLSRTGQLPVGAKWVAMLGTVFGPEVRRDA